MDFLGVSTWVFEFLVMQMLPLVSMILLAVGIFKTIFIIPETVTKFTKRMGGMMKKGLR